jgi:acetolactate synthase-1/2/3 large subunit
MKVSDYVMSRLVAAGANHVFLVPGGAAMHLNDSLAKEKALGWTATFHEQASSTAAECHGKMRQKLGVAMVTAGPGSTNAMSGVASAWCNSSPLLVLAGQVKSADLKKGAIRQNGLQEIDAVSMAKPITKYAATVEKADTVRYHLEKAIYLATHGRPGPVWLTFPQDVAAHDIDPDKLEGFTPDAPAASKLDAQVGKIIEQLNKSERPVLFAGLGIRLGGGQPRFLELIDALGIPIQTSWAAIDLLPEDHPMYAGRPGAFASRASNFIMQNSDFMLSLGARLDLATTGFARDRFARGAFRVAVDVDPAEIEKLGKDVELGIIADAAAVVEELWKRRDEIVKKPRAEWWTRVKDWTKRYPLVTKEQRGLKDATSTYVLVEKLAQLLSEGDTIVSGGSGVHAEIFFAAFQTKKDQRVVTDASLGSMGYGLPATIGACVAAGRKRTVLVDGDGGLQPQLQELQTVVREKLPLKIVVVNNNGYSSIRVSQGRYFNRLIAADETSGLTMAPFSKIAAAYGIRSIRIENEGELEAKLKEGLAGDDPVIIDVVVPRDEDRVPRLNNMQKANGQMVSKPLEDMFPFLDREEFRANMIIPPIEED